MTDEYDPTHRPSIDPSSRRRSHAQGIAARAWRSPRTAEVDRTSSSVGFEVSRGARDHGSAEDGCTPSPWYQPMEGRYAATPWARYSCAVCRCGPPKALVAASSAAESVHSRIPTRLRRRPVLRLLDRTANAYVTGGGAGIFTAALLLPGPQARLIPRASDIARRDLQLLPSNDGSDRRLSSPVVRVLTVRRAMAKRPAPRCGGDAPPRSPTSRSSHSVLHHASAAACSGRRPRRSSPAGRPGSRRSASRRS